MKKICKEFSKNKQLVAGVFLAGILVALGTTAIYSKVIDGQIGGDNVATETYGKLGYGRGDGSATGDKQGYGRNQQGLSKDNCLMDGCLLVEDADYPVGELDAKTIGYLEAALADEQKALFTYEAVMDKFGDVKPFINIARAEEQHIATLKALFDKYGVTIPQDISINPVLPDTLAEVCQVGVEAEIANDQLYQDMIGDIAEQDIKDVFSALANASIEMHLPAFERCAN